MKWHQMTEKQRSIEVMRIHTYHKRAEAAGLRFCDHSCQSCKQECRHARIHQPAPSTAGPPV